MRRHAPVEVNKVYDPSFYRMYSNNFKCKIILIQHSSAIKYYLMKEKNMQFLESKYCKKPFAFT